MVAAIVGSRCQPGGSDTWRNRFGARDVKRFALTEHPN
jgi:hypothetical protein